MSLLTSTGDRTLLHNISWVTLITGVERLAAILQTILVARALGITAYGVYGLLFGVIGLIASTAGMQMGLTATVFVSRYRETEKAKAAYVVRFTNRFALAVAAAVLICTIPNARLISTWLVGSSTTELAIVASSLLVALSIISGVQDGIMQGFEAFKVAALARLVTTVMTLSVIYPAGLRFGLPGVMGTVLLGVVVKYALLGRYLSGRLRQDGLTVSGDGVVGADLMWRFSVPSMLVSFLSGAIGWGGTFLLSRQIDGFNGLAVVNTGLQWRGPILLMSSIVSSVAIPAISRHYHQTNEAAVQRLHRRMLALNASFSLLVALPLVALSRQILSLYGPKFVDGAVVFSLLVAASVPQVVAGVYLQQLVAKGRMWQQLWLHFWLVVPLAIGFATIVPTLHGIGFALTYGCSWTIFALMLAFHVRPDRPVSIAQAAA